MQDKYKPYERPERPVEPPEYPTIPEGESGYYNAFSDEFVPDDLAFEEAIENWDLMSAKDREVFKRFLVDLYFKDWERIRGE